MHRSFGFGVLVLSLLASPAFANGDPKAGKKVFKKCRACHTVEAGKSRVGPTLYRIVGAPSAAVEGFRYSDALTDAKLTWDAETLSAFLSDPRQVVPGNKMAFGGLKDQEDIDDLIAYLIAEGED